MFEYKWATFAFKYRVQLRIIIIKFIYEHIYIWTQRTRVKIHFKHIFFSSLLLLLSVHAYFLPYVSVFPLYTHNDIILNFHYWCFWFVRMGSWTVIYTLTRANIYMYSRFRQIVHFSEYHLHEIHSRYITSLK